MFFSKFYTSLFYLILFNKIPNNLLRQISTFLLDDPQHHTETQTLNTNIFIYSQRHFLGLLSKSRQRCG